MNFVKRIIKVLIPFYSSYVKSVSSGVHNQSYWNYVRFRLTGNCSKAGYYPVHPTCTIANARKVYVGCNATIARPGCYIQGAGTVYIGDYVQFGPNVGILSANHDIYDQRKYNAAPITIGVVKYLDKDSFRPWHLENEYYGYIPKEEFESVRKKYLDI